MMQIGVGTARRKKLPGIFVTDAMDGWMHAKPQMCRTGNIHCILKGGKKGDSLMEASVYRSIDRDGMQEQEMTGVVAHQGLFSMVAKRGCIVTNTLSSAAVQGNLIESFIAKYG